MKNKMNYSIKGKKRLFLPAEARKSGSKKDNKKAQKLIIGLLEEKRSNHVSSVQFVCRCVRKGRGQSLKEGRHRSLLLTG